MKDFCIFLLIAAVMFGQWVPEADAAVSGGAYKIAIHQANPNDKDHGVTCRRDAAKCHFVLPLKSKTGIGTVDVDIQFENDQACLEFKFGTTVLQSEAGCLKIPSSQKVTLYFPGEPEKSGALYQDLVGRGHYRVVADIVVTVGPPGR